MSKDDADGEGGEAPGFWTVFMSSSSNTEKIDPAVARELELKERMLTAYHFYIKSLSSFPQYATCVRATSPADVPSEPPGSRCVMTSTAGESHSDSKHDISLFLSCSRPLSRLCALLLACALSLVCAVSLPLSLVNPKARRSKTARR